MLFVINFAFQIALLACVSRAFLKGRHGAHRLIKSLTRKKASKGNVFIARLYSTLFPQLKVLKRMFLVQVVNFRVPFLKNKMNWGERVFLAYQMKVLKLFSDKLFQMTIAEIADLLVPIESKSDRQRTPSSSPARRFFLKKSGSGFVTAGPKQNFEKLVLVNHFPHENIFRMKPLSAINHFPHETTFRHKPYSGKECVPFRPFFLP
ncbi:hypothetical protein [Bartonella apis]|uniref:hypothetical protein n=1 Tax=Bartonella apis TaxID=1686310 RepID=UPI0018DC957B|nr:hypothetical protein [Bartonella apis]MBI0177543.1 hypothetical protein [Bartonella apis]